MTQPQQTAKLAKGYPAVGECRLSLIEGITWLSEGRGHRRGRDSSLIPDPG
jgi:hypothetical protein